MVKKILKGAICAALSLSMALGSVMVGANEDKVSEATIVSETGTGEFIQESSSLKKFVGQKNKVAKSNGVVKATNLWTLDNYNAFMKNSTAQDGVYGTIGAEASGKNILVGYIQVEQAGTVIIKYYCQQNGTDKSLTLVNKNGTSIAGATVNNTGSGNSRAIWATNVPAGTYALITMYSYYKNDTINAGFLSAVVPKANNRTITKAGIVVGGNGGYNYQYFKLKKRGVAALGMQRMAYYGGPYSVSYKIQKKSGGKWKNVTSGSGSTKYVGLSAGTYRLATKVDKGNIVGLQYIGTTANSSYGTAKKKAKTIKRKKSKSQVILPTDSTKKAQWYKIKVTAKRNTYIDVTSLGQSGTIRVQVSGGTRFKSKNIKNGIRFYAKAKKGTYYIKVYKSSKKTTGGYKVKYVK